ncbi:hypothetical protein ACIBF6_21955 [Streptosporangium amethystogenes]|uniref:hypothetical protein n=1 Tax=Streptosporangium amethystogenes TaxID=2002 RepID=UPI0037B8ADF4
MDGDPTLKAAAKSIAIKVISPVEPVIPPAPPSLAGLPFVPVEFEELTVTPWINGDGDRARIAYSYRARGLRGVTLPGPGGGAGKGSKDAG